MTKADETPRSAGKRPRKATGSRSKAARRRPSQERSRELVRAVREAGRLLLDEAGPEALTTNRIAERAGVSVGSLYQYFENKEAIVKAIYDEASQEEREGVAELLGKLRAMDPKERLRVGVVYAAQRHRAMLELDADYYREHHGKFRISSQMPDFAEESNQIGTRAVEFARQLLKEEEPRLNGAVDVDHAAFLMGRGVSAILRAALEDSPELLSDPSFIDELVKMMLRYIYPEPGC
jgi:AcrR family transcriptional regulator